MKANRIKLELLTLLLLIETFFFSVEWNACFTWKILCKWKLSSWNWETARRKQKTEDSLLKDSHCWFYQSELTTGGVLALTDHLSSLKCCLKTCYYFEHESVLLNNWCKILCVIMKFVADRQCVKNICILMLTTLQHSLLTEKLQGQVQYWSFSNM